MEQGDDEKDRARQHVPGRHPTAPHLQSGKGEGTMKTCLNSSRKLYDSGFRAGAARREGPLHLHLQALALPSETASQQ